jgi:hypothetical protein
MKLTRAEKFGLKKIGEAYIIRQGKEDFKFAIDCTSNNPIKCNFHFFYFDAELKKLYACKDTILFILSQGNQCGFILPLENSGFYEVSIEKDEIHFQQIDLPIQPVNYSAIIPDQRELNFLGEFKFSGKEEQNLIQVSKFSAVTGYIMNPINFTYMIGDYKAYSKLNDVNKNNSIAFKKDIPNFGEVMILIMAMNPIALE